MEVTVRFNTGYLSSVLDQKVLIVATLRIFE